jgi:ABC-type multidrug transport system fused ATPase/permease subunit
MTGFPPSRLAAAFYNAFLKDTGRLLATLTPRLRLRWLSVMALEVATAVMETVSLVAMSIFALSIASPEAVPDSLLVKPLLSLFPGLGELFGSPRRLVALASLVMVCAVAVKCAVATATVRGISLFNERVVFHASVEALRHFLARDYLWHSTPDSEDAIHRVVNRHYLGEYTLYLLQFYYNSIICVILFASLSFLEPGLTAIAGAVFGTAAILLFAGYRRRIDRLGEEMHRTAREQNRYLMAAARGIREITVHRAQDLALQGFTQALGRGQQSKAILGYMGLMPAQILEALGFLTMSAIVVGMLAADIPMEGIVSTASLLMLTAWRILPSINRCLSCSVHVRGLRPSAMSFLELVERFRAEAGPPPPDPAPDFAFRESLRLRGVSFRYPGKGENALSGIDLEIPKGARIGLVGPSGSGKSSLAILLSGLAPPSAGEFLVDGRPLDPPAREAYFRILGYVPQNPVILDGTLAENVAFSGWVEGRDGPRIEAALRRAAADFALAEGALDTPLSGSTQTLSGGQIQRVAIARALYSDPQVILFDEATSALDQASENLIRRTLDEAGPGVTSIVIAHRLTTVESCDTLYWLDGGRIVRSGPPSEIIPLYMRDAEIKEAEMAARGGGAPPPPPASPAAGGAEGTGPARGR